MKNHSIIAIGASAGGVRALRQLFAQLPADLDAAFFVVLHTPAGKPSLLSDLLGAVTPLRVKKAEDGEAIIRSNVYIAPPDFHMLVKEDYIRLYKGPHENRHRPAIDRRRAKERPEQRGRNVSGAFQNGSYPRTVNSQTAYRKGQSLGDQLENLCCYRQALLVQNIAAPALQLLRHQCFCCLICRGRDLLRLGCLGAPA